MYQSLSITTPAASLPVDLATFKEHLKINTGDDDTAATLYLDAAVECLTKWTGYVPVATGFTLTADSTHWWCGDWYTVVVPLPRWPVSAITQVQVRNADGTYTTVPTANYRLVGDRQLWVDRSALPVTYPLYPAGLKVVFTAGAASVETTVKLAILQLAGVSYRFREATTEIRLADVPYACRAILEGLKGGEL